LHRLHQIDTATVAVIILAHGTFHFGLPGMANEDTLAPFSAELGHFKMHLGHKRASGIKYLKAPGSCLGLNFLGDTVSAEDHNGAPSQRIHCRDIMKLIHENSAALA